MDKILISIELSPLRGILQMVNQACPKCGKPMSLLDEDEKRYYCYSDDVVYIGSENRWLGMGGQQPSANAAKAPEPKTKSVGLAFLLNFLLFAGAGLMYADEWFFGIIYLVAALFFIFVFPILALALALVSYVHTYVAIESYNTKARLASKSVSPPVSTQTDMPTWHSSNCPKCGKPMTDQATQYYCIADDILIHKATGLWMIGVPAEDYFINHRTNAGDLGDLYLSLTRDLMVLSDEKGKIVASMALKDLTNTSIVNQRDGSRLRLDTANQTFLLRTGNNDLWEKEIERRIPPQDATRVYDESAVIEIQGPEPPSIAKSTMFCRECGANIPRKSRFCNKCGTKADEVRVYHQRDSPLQVTYCLYCDRKLPSDASFCRYCGRQQIVPK